MAATVEELHQALFGFRPAKEGAAYERLTALVLAVLGWQEVKYDTRERPPGRRALHQLDVTARHPDGVVRRLLVECKDWNKTVGKGTLDQLVGVRDQIGADAAAVVTTVGFTKGAREVAVDEDVALITLKPYDPAGSPAFVRAIELTLIVWAPIRENWDVEVMPECNLPSGTQVRFTLSGEDHLRRLDGAPAEQLQEVIESDPSLMEAGTYPKRAEFPDGRLLATADGPPLPIRALKWDERMVSSEHVSRTEAKGEPMLVLQQLDERGEAASGRLVVDLDLFAWEIDADGNVIARGELE